MTDPTTRAAHAEPYDPNDELGTDDTSFTDYEATVISAEFSIQEQGRNAGKPAITFTMRTNDPEVDLWHETYNLGTTKTKVNWLIDDEGERVTAEDGSKRFRDNSSYGKFINKCRELAQKELIDHQCRARVAPSWIGSRWFMAAEKGSFDGEGGEKVNWSKNYPVEYLGWEGDDGEPF